MRVLTLGYQGIGLDDYVELLKVHSVGLVVDVRETPWSFKRGFSKAPLEAALNAAAIQYRHLKSAGNPSINRKTARSTAECLSRYRRHLVKHPLCIEELLSLIRKADESNAPACLTCYESLPRDCHRSVLLEALRERDPDLAITHLWQAGEGMLKLGKEPLPSI